MKYSTLDQITRSILMNKGYSLHWYVQFLKYGSDCLRELAMDDLKIINTAVLTINSYGAAKIPSDCIDAFAVGMENGEYFKPMVQTSGLLRNYNFSPQGNPIPWPTVPESALSSLAIFGVPFLTYYMLHYNSRGENLGGLYGFKTDGAPFIYQVMKERNEIQFDSNFGNTTAVLMYISDGRNATAATQVDTYAEKTIEDYVDWQHLEHNRNISGGEKERKKMQYVGSRTVLRGRENNMGGSDIKDIFRNAYTATIKN
jgi:hypothetical protein